MSVIREVMGLACCAFQIKGFYVLVPSYYTMLLLCKEQEKKKPMGGLGQRLRRLTGIGVIAGCIGFMPFATAVRYLMIMVTTTAVIHFYIWANGYCKGLVAGGIVAVITSVISLGGAMLLPGKNIGLLGVCEGLVSVGLMLVWERVLNNRGISFGVPEKRRREIACDQASGTEPYTGRIAEAIRGISGILEEPSCKMQTSSGAVAMDRAWHNRMLLDRSVIVAELNALADMLGKREDGTRRAADKWLQGRVRRLQCEAAENGIALQHISIERDNQERIRVEVEATCKWKGLLEVDNYRRALERTLHCPMRLACDTQENISEHPQRIVAYEETPFYVLTGAACRKKDGAVTIGDTYFTMEGDEGRFFGGISDGMGTGSSAREESELLVEVLQKLLRAGFTSEKALHMLDAALSLRQAEDRYSTLDLVDIDLYSGMASLYKAGAPLSFIKRNQKVQVIAGNTLPAGSGVQQSMSVASVEMQHGDFLVMITDGVIEYLHMNSPEEEIADIIRNIRTDNAGAVALGILERVMCLTGDRAEDDMTVLVAGLWER